MIPVDAIPPLTRTTLREQAYRLIRQMIIAGRLAPGASLSERAIGDQLGVSRAPIKDALLRLEREGFVVSRSDGRYVKELDRQAILQMYEVRERLEVLAAQLAAAAITPPKAAFLAEALAKYRAACEAQNLEAFATADVAIHTAIWEQAENPYLLNALSCIAAPTFMRVSDCARFADEHWTTPLSEHEAIIAAISRGDVAAAGQAMEGHVRHALARSLRASAGMPGDAPAGSDP